MQIEVLMKDVETNETEYYQALGQKVFEKRKCSHSWMCCTCGMDVRNKFVAKNGKDGQRASSGESNRMQESLQKESVCCNMSQHADRFVFPRLNTCFIDEVQDVCYLWLGTLSNYYFRAKFGSGRYLPIVLSSYNDFHIRTRGLDF